MNLGLSNIQLPVFKDVNTTLYNERISQLTEDADLISCGEVLSLMIDEYNRLNVMAQLAVLKKPTKSAVAVAESLAPSVEFNIFDIIGAIVKAIYNIGLWFLKLIGKIWKGVMKFFSRDMKNSERDINNFGPKLPLMQTDNVAKGIYASELDKAVAIFDSHVAAKGSAVTDKEGTTIEQYRKKFYQTFNASVPAQAKVNEGNGQLIERIRCQGGKIGAMGWTDESTVHQGEESIKKIKKDLKDCVEELNSQSKDVKDIITYIDSSGALHKRGDLDNKWVQDKAPEVIDAASMATILIHDLVIAEMIEQNWLAMTDLMNKVSRKYVAAKQ